MERSGADITLLPTKTGPGLYPALDSWRLLRTPGFRLLGGFIRTLATRPKASVALLLKALHTGTLAELVLAAGNLREAAGSDVLYATFGDRKLFIAYYLKLLTGLPLVVKIHAYELYANPNPGLFQEALAAAQRILTVTEHNRKLLVERFKAPGDRVDVVRIAVDTDGLRPRKRFALLTVAFFAERKGHETLLRALRHAGPGVEAWIVGGPGPELPVDVPELAREFGVADQVAFFGALKDAALSALYDRCDAFCLPCRTDSSGIQEGFPTAIAEAMAAGKPVITTRHAGIPEVLSEVLVPENDEFALAAAINYLQEAPSKRRQLGLRNRGIAEREFSLRNAAATLAALEEAAAGQAAVPAGNAVGDRTPVSVTTGTGAAVISRPRGGE